MSSSWWPLNESELALLAAGERDVAQEISKIHPDPLHPKWYFAIKVGPDIAGTALHVKNLVLIDFSPEILPLILKLPALRELLLTGSEPTRVLPPPPGLLPNLTNLSIKQFTNLPVEKWMENVPKIESLSIAYNSSIVIPDTLSRLTQLKFLILYENSQVHLPNALGDLINLQYLSLEKNNLSHLPLSIQNLRELIVFDINNNAFEHFPWQIGYCEKLRQIQVMRNPWLADASVFLTKYGLARQRSDIAKGDIKRFLAECRERFDALQQKTPPPPYSTQINGVQKLFES